MTLRRYRENRGFTLEDAARVLECDRSKISRIETGQRGIRARDLRDLIAEYDIDEKERAILSAIATSKGTSGWWQKYEDVLTGESPDYLMMEALAGQILTYHTQQIPGLLQTRAYAVAVAEASTSAPDPYATRRAAEATLARQGAILGAKEAELAVIIAQGALHQQVGGADVMRGQLARLAELADTSPQLTIQVLPFAVGAYPGLGVGGLTILYVPRCTRPGRAPSPYRGRLWRHLPGRCRGRHAPCVRVRPDTRCRLQCPRLGRNGPAYGRCTSENETAERSGVSSMPRLLHHRSRPRARQRSEAIGPQASCARCSFTFPLLPAEFASVTLEAIHGHDCCPSRAARLS